MPSNDSNPAGASAKPSDAASTIESGWNWHDETNALIRAAIESANDAIVITDVELDAPGPRIEYVNRAFTQMTGYTAEEVLGKTPRILQGPKTDRKLLERLRSDLVAGRVFFGETINYRKDGSEYAVEWRITGMRDPQGRVLKWVAIQRDVSERKLAEEKRHQLFEAERAAREEAERVGRMKDEFLATLSHELRTPLNAILGWASMIERGQLNPDESRRAAEIIQRNAKSQARLVDDLLDMSRIMSGQIRLDLRRMPFAPAVDAAVQALVPSALAKAITLEAELDRNTGVIKGDANRIQQILWNLLSNAIKFTPAGGLVQVRLEPVNGLLARLTVADNGIGIDRQFLPFVFDRFRQADASITRRHGGLGLGLSIAKFFAELHGATIEVSSPGPDRGATFIVQFPLLPLDPAKDAESLPRRSVFTVEDAVNIVGLNILVVDDDDDARTFFRWLFTSAGANVIEAASARQALEVWHEHVPDILLSDIGMPQMDGYELIRALRERHAPADRPFPPAIAVTAFARADDRRRALLAGFQSHLTKPVNPQDLLIEVASLCRRT